MKGSLILCLVEFSQPHLKRVIKLTIGKNSEKKLNSIKSVDWATFYLLGTYIYIYIDIAIHIDL